MGNNKTVAIHRKMVIVRNHIDSQCVFYFKPCQNDSLLFNCFLICSSVHLWSQLKEAEQLLRDQRSWNR